MILFWKRFLERRVFMTGLWMGILVIGIFFHFSTKAGNLLIRDAIIVTMNEKNESGDRGDVIVGGNLVIENDKISYIGKEVPHKKFDRIIDGKGKVVIPGIINTHTHVPMTVFRGLADDMNFEEWFFDTILPVETNYLGPELVYQGARLGILEMIRSGTTTFADMYLYEEYVARAVDELGVRGLLGQSITDYETADGNRDAQLRKLEKFIKKWKGHPRITPAAAPHAPYSTSPETYLKVREIILKHDLPMHTHLSENSNESQAAINSPFKIDFQGRSPVQHLESQGVFEGVKAIAAHMVFPEKGDIEVMKHRCMGVAHCPQSNLKLASGVAPIVSLRKHGIPVGLGTDGAASNNDLNLWDEIDLVGKLHKGWLGERKVISAYEAFKMATIEGARAIGLDKKIGSLEVGKQADIIILNFEALHLIPLYNIYSHLANVVKASDVERVIVDGTIIYEEGQYTQIESSEIEKIKASIREYQNKIISDQRVKNKPFDYILKGQGSCQKALRREK